MYQPQAVVAEEEVQEMAMVPAVVEEAHLEMVQTVQQILVVMVVQVAQVV